MKKMDKNIKDNKLKRITKCKKGPKSKFFNSFETWYQKETKER